MPTPHPDQDGVDISRVANPLASIKENVRKLVDELEELVKSKGTSENERRIQFLMKHISKYNVFFFLIIFH